MIGDVAKFVGDRTGLELRFESALRGLWMAYQPIVSFPAMLIYGYEALVRTAEPSLATPELLFDAAQRLHRLGDLGRAIRASVARTMSQSPAQFVFFVNIHPVDLFDEALFDAAAPLTQRASSVVLEVTERAAFDDMDATLARADRLRKLGFRIALDDLGAGHAGLGWFAQVLPEIIKVDMSLVRGVDRDEAKQRAIASMVGLSSDSHMMLIAEGVETTGERDMLAKLGCELLQGYFFGKPARDLLASSALPS